MSSREDSSATVPDDDANPVAGIPIADLVDHYESRSLDLLSDVELVDAVGTIVSEPRHGPADSFVLHAPLELGARAALLPLVPTPQRHLARLHIVAVAAQYETYEPADFGKPLPLSQQVDPAVWLLEALHAGDLDEVDRAVVALTSSTGPHELVRALADAVLPMTAAAAHAPIFLLQLVQQRPVSGYRAQLLRPLARELARNPQNRLRWMDDQEPFAEKKNDEAVAADLTRTLAATPLIGADSTFIHPLMSQVDQSDDITAQLASALGPDGPSAQRAVLRTAARSMLEDTSDHAPYGWTHCLTMPQAVLGVAPFTSNPDRALAVAATHVAAFRAGLGAVELSPPAGDITTGPEINVAALAGAAATSHDAHVAKYVLACLDASRWDGPCRRLYLAAAQRLLDVWQERGGDPTDPLG